MNHTEFLASELSGAELSCLSETGDPQQLLKLVNSKDATPQEREALESCLENKTLLKIYLQELTDEIGPLSSNTSTCISAGLENLDLPAIMLPNMEAPDKNARIVQGLARLIITRACLDEQEWQAASQPMGLQPDGMKDIQCTLKLLGGPEGIVASLEPEEGEMLPFFFNTAEDCEPTMTEEPPG